MPKKKAGGVLPRLTEAEQDLLWHMEQDYQLETDSLDRDPAALERQATSRSRAGESCLKTLKFLSWAIMCQDQVWLGVVKSRKGVEAFTLGEAIWNPPVFRLVRA
jgi:hypothetical protein